MGFVSRIQSGLPLMFLGAVLATDVIFTSLVVGRLVYYQRRQKKLMGARSTSHYTSIATMVIESASLNIVFQVLALASTANDSQNIFSISIYLVRPRQVQFIS